MRTRDCVDVSHKSTAYIEGPSNFSTHSRSGEVLPPQQGTGSGRRKRGRKDVKVTRTSFPSASGCCLLYTSSNTFPGTSLILCHGGHLDLASESQPTLKHSVAFYTSVIYYRTARNPSRSSPESWFTSCPSPDLQGDGITVSETHHLVSVLLTGLGVPRI